MSRHEGARRRPRGGLNQARSTHPAMWFQDHRREFGGREAGAGVARDLAEAGGLHPVLAGSLDLLMGAADEVPPQLRRRSPTPVAPRLRPRVSTRHSRRSTSSTDAGGEIRTIHGPGDGQPRYQSPSPPVSAGATAVPPADEESAGPPPAVCWGGGVSERKPHPSDLSDGPWALIEPVITAWKGRHRSVSGHQGAYQMREIVNAILYQGRNGSSTAPRCD